MISALDKSSWWLPSNVTPNYWSFIACYPTVLLRWCKEHAWSCMVPSTWGFSLMRLRSSLILKSFLSSALPLLISTIICYVFVVLNRHLINLYFSNKYRRILPHVLIFNTSTGWAWSWSCPWLSERFSRLSSCLGFLEYYWLIISIVALN